MKAQILMRIAALGAICGMTSLHSFVLAESSAVQTIDLAAPHCTGIGGCAEPGIERWCKPGTSDVRFTSAGIQPDGYERCGAVEVSQYCDALGNKLYSNDKSVPYDFKKCGEPRIYMERDGEPIDIPMALARAEQGTPVRESPPGASTVDGLGGYYSMLDGMIDGGAPQRSAPEAVPPVSSGATPTVKERHQAVTRAMGKLERTLDLAQLTQGGVGRGGENSLMKDIDVKALERDLRTYIDTYDLPENFFGE